MNKDQKILEELRKTSLKSMDAKEYEMIEEQVAQNGIEGLKGYAKSMIEKGMRDLAYQMKKSLEDYEKASAKGLENKVKEHNEAVGDVAGKRTTVGVLQQVYNRGVGAYRTNPSSVRPNVTSEQQWAMGRVNGFLHALRNGRFKRKAYDTDLLPKEHALSSKGKESDIKKALA